MKNWTANEAIWLAKIKAWIQDRKKINEIYFECWERYRTRVISSRHETDKFHRFHASIHVFLCLFYILCLFQFWLVSQNTIIGHVWLSCIMAWFANNTVYSGPLLTYRMGWGDMPLPPPPPVRSLRTTWSRWSTSNYVSKWENDVKLLTSLNLTIICRLVTSYGSTESVDSPVGQNLHGDLNLNIARNLNHDWNNLLVEQGMTEWHFRTMFSFSK